jgi:hypothetical protein
MFRKSHRIALIATAVAGALASVPSAASAEVCSPMGDSAGPQFGVRICGAPDVDQFRSGLYANGNTFCGPTSLFDSLYYLRNVKGVPIRLGTQGIGGLDPLNPAHYETITDRLRQLGFVTGTMEDGSTAAANRDAFDWATKYADENGWITQAGVISSSSNDDFPIQIAQYLHAMGPLQLWYGRYAKNVDGTYTRSGGHAVSVVGAFGIEGDDEVELWLHDPARNGTTGTGSLDTQSPVRVEVVKLKKVTFRKQNKD